MPVIDQQTFADSPAAPVRSSEVPAHKRLILDSLTNLRAAMHALHSGDLDKADDELSAAIINAQGAQECINAENKSVNASRP
jgi:hypothetical protein